MSSTPWAYSLQAGYSDYLKSAWWQIRRQQALADGGHKCAKCGGQKRLRVHHLSYDRLGKEEARDLEVLCWRCHDALHDRKPVDTTTTILAKIGKQMMISHAAWDNIRRGDPVLLHNEKGKVLARLIPVGGKVCGGR